MLLSIIAWTLLDVAAAMNLRRKVDVTISNSTPYLDYWFHVCTPDNSTGAPDLTAPCNLWQNTWLECSGALRPGDNLTFAQEQSCFCSVPWADYFQGCTNCANAHGLQAMIEPIPSAPLTSWTSSYCSATPTKSFEADLNSAFPVSSTIILSRLPTTWSDPTGNRTEVSLYYTATTTASALARITSGSGAVSTSAGSARVASSTQSTASSSGLAAIATFAPDRLHLAAIVCGVACGFAALA